MCHMPLESSDQELSNGMHNSERAENIKSNLLSLPSIVHSATVVLSTYVVIQRASRTISNRISLQGSMIPYHFPDSSASRGPRPLGNFRSGGFYVYVLANAHTGRCHVLCCRFYKEYVTLYVRSGVGFNSREMQILVFYCIEFFTINIGLVLWCTINLH